MEQRFIEPQDDFEFIITETGQFTTYGDLRKTIDPDLMPKTEADYQEFLKVMGLIEVGYQS